MYLHKPMLYAVLCSSTKVLCSLQFYAIVVEAFFKEPSLARLNIQRGIVDLRNGTAGTPVIGSSTYEPVHASEEDAAHSSTSAF